MRSLFVAVVTVLAGCASSGPVQQTPMARVTLPGVGMNSGHLAYANLVERGQGTDVTVEASGVVGDWVSAPVHLYTYVYQGSCANLGPPVYPATAVVLAQSYAPAPSTNPKLLAVSNTIPVGLQALRSQPYAIGVRSSRADADRLLFCGNLQG